MSIARTGELVCASLRHHSWAAIQHSHGTVKAFKKSAIKGTSDWTAQTAIYLNLDESHY